VCTIRSTPSQPIHCIVWGKSYLLAEIFGISEEETPELDFTTDSENAEEIAKLRAEAEALKNIRDSMGSEQFSQLIFDKVFKDDINRLRSMEEMWKTRRAPEALSFEKLSNDKLDNGLELSRKDQAAWTVEENFAVFCDSLRRLSERMQAMKADPESGPTVITFDKDDVDTLDFVVASANLRSHIFGIDMRSKFDIKQMAGNIIPAIATTNAIIAGLCVMQAFKIMRGQIEKAPMIFTGGVGRAMTAENKVRPPRPDCAVCGVARANITLDPSRATLRNLVEDVLRDKLGYGEELSILTENGVVYDPDMEENLALKFGDLAITTDSFITIQDDEDGDTPRVNLVLNILEASLPEEGASVQLSESIDIPRKPKPLMQEPAKATNGDAATNGSDQTTNGKRKRSADDAELEEASAKKKGKAPVMPSADDEVIFIDDAADGAIVIDD
jgi:ubiquitin-like 1-activating enzyme E1 B